MRGRVNLLLARASVSLPNWGPGMRLQTVISTLMIVSGNLIDRQCRGTVSYSPEIVPTWHGKEVGGDSVL